jgi:pimeloyl-ACP methyl ester carboxylesterase
MLSPHAGATVIGYDWEASICWTTALTHPDKVRAVAGLPVRFLGRPKFSLGEIFDRHYAQRGLFFDQNYFALEGVAEDEFEMEVRVSLRKFLYVER